MMAPRLPPTTRRLLATRAPLQRPLLSLRVTPSPEARTVQANWNTSRPLSTTPPRPWLLSALPNLAPGGANNNPSPPKTLRARRTLPYPPAQIYTLIADIDSYTHFLPHCAHSRVTRWTTPPPPAPAPGQQQPPHNTTTTQPPRHPAQADLTVGWGPFTQTYTSRVYCVPGSVVEAVSGAASTSIPPDTLRAAGYDLPDDAATGATGNKGADKMEGIFESLVTRWTVRPIKPSSSSSSTAAAVEGGGEWTEVTLSVTFQFANPALGFAVGQLADDKVTEMVEAFEGRARALYGNGR